MAMSSKMLLKTQNRVKKEARNRRIMADFYRSKGDKTAIYQAIAYKHNLSPVTVRRIIKNSLNDK